MVAYLTKSDASEGFNQIIDFLNGSCIKYALTVNPNIYVSYIKQFWTTVAVKKVNDVIRLQALVDKKKVVVTEATIQEVLCLDDAKGVECLHNEEIFSESIHKAYVLQGILLQRVEKVFANMRRVGKGFFGVETPMFVGMLVEQQVAEEGDVEVHGAEVNACDTAEGDVSAAHAEVPTVAEEPSIPSPTPPTPPPQPSHDIPSTSQAQPTPPQSPQVPPQSPQIAQALEITKLKRRVKKLERRNKVKVLKLKRLQKVGTSQRVKTSNEIVLDDVSNQGRIIAELDQDVDVVLEDDKEEAKELKVQEVVTAAKIITKVVTAASENITAASTTITAAEAQDHVVTLIAAPTRVTAAPSRRRKRVVIRDPEESNTSIIIPAETKSKDKGKGILVEESKPLKKQKQIEQDEKYARELEAELNKNIDWDEAIDYVNKKAKEDNAVKRYQAMKRKPHTKAQARKNMMVYLKNTKEQIEEEESIVLKRINETPAEKAAKKQKLDEEVEELKRHLQIVPNEDDDVYTEATSLARKVPIVDYEIINMNNKPYYKIIKADGTHQLYKNQRSVHGQAKVKSWKLLESCGVQIITFTTTHLILLVERKYPLTRFTLDQMLNVIRLEVEEESKVFGVVKFHSITTSRRPARVMVKYILHQAQEQDLVQAC
nr:xylulose kinase-1 [Tanacetum cinerariifolium]GEW28018.1 xylulose kinase-1 [Tanacetum cinerariifolium]